MKLENCIVGQRVETKAYDSTNDVCRYLPRYCGKVGAIISDTELAHDLVRVEFDDGTSDYGHHSLIRKVK